LWAKLNQNKTNLMPSSSEPSWFAVCMSQDKTLLHMRWHPLPDAVQEVLRKAVDRKDTEVEIEAHLEQEDGRAAALAAPPAASRYGEAPPAAPAASRYGEAPAASRYKILLRYWEEQEIGCAAAAPRRFRDAQQINQATMMVRAIRRFRGDADHYLRVVAMAKNIVISTVADMDEATPKKRRKSATAPKAPPPLTTTENERSTTK
jgi:hypothetical protein